MSLIVAGAPGAIGATLVGFSVAQVSPTLVRAQMDFVPQAPQYRIDGAATNRVSIQFFATTKRPGLNSIPGGATMIRSVDVAGLSYGPQLNGSSLSNGFGGLNSGQSLTTLPTQQLSAVPQTGIRISDTISIDRRLNAVILSGPASVTEPLKKLIALVDTPVSSVFFEASVVELTESAARDVGIDFSSGGPLATASLGVKSFSQPSGTISLQSAIYGQVQRGQGRIIARPTVLAQSGTPASINTGDSIPIFTNIAFPATGSTIVQQQVQYVNVGVNLQIVATVDVDNGVHARVIANVSSVTGFVQGVRRSANGKLQHSPISRIDSR